MTFPVGGTGLEEVGKAAFIHLVTNVNTYLGIVEAAWTTDDQELATLLGRPYGPITLERIAKENMHYGHIPSMIEAPVGNYPNLSVLAYESASQGQWVDQHDARVLRFYVEVLVKSDVSEEECNARISRTADAIDRTIAVDPTLGGTVLDTLGQNFTISDVFKRSELKGRGQDFWWQGARLEYQVQRPVLY